jgi:hypothetical protein
MRSAASLSSDVMPVKCKLLVLTLLVATAGIALLAIGPRGSGFWRPGPLVDSARFGDYEVRIYCRHEENLLEKICGNLPYPLSNLQYHVPGMREWNGVEVLKHGRRVHSQYGSVAGGMQIAQFGSRQVAGLDITGDGVPKLALSQESGRQGGGSLQIFACGKEFKRIASIESVGKYPELKDLDGDGIPELIVSDNAFYHWPICMDGEPLPEVILRWRNGGYIPAADLMAKPAPTHAKLEELAASIRQSAEWDANSCSVPEVLWTNAVALMYSGQEQLGWKFVDLAWKAGFPGNGVTKEYAIDNVLRSRLEESLYWPKIHMQKLRSASPIPGNQAGALR